MSAPLMPKATAIWLVENTALTFKQIADFTKLHELEVQALADEEHDAIRPIDPIVGGQLDAAQITKAEADPTLALTLKQSTLPKPKARKKGPKYVPLNKRADKPCSIAWILKNHPTITDAQMVKLIGTTKTTIEKIRTRTHWDMQNINPIDPVELGLCSSAELEEAVRKSAPSTAPSVEG